MNAPKPLVYALGFCLWALLANAGLADTSLSSGTLAAGSKWETPYHVIDSQIAGPTVLLIGGMHGNEPAGSRAAEQIRHWPIAKGRMIVVPRANVRGLAENLRHVPDRPDPESDLNRNFPRGEKGEVVPRGVLASALWDLASRVRPDWILDLHEGYEFHVSHEPAKGKKKSVGSSVIYAKSEAMDALARQLVSVANTTVSDPDKTFVRLRNGTASTGIVAACVVALGAKGFILETTYQEQALSLRVKQHRLMADAFLRHLGVIDQACHDRLAAPRSPSQLAVGAFDGNGVGPSSANLFAVIDRADDVALHHLGPTEIRPGILAQFDVLVFPGGSGSKQAKAIGATGRQAVRDFVRSGGGYLGVCAGAYLCSASYEWSLDLVDAKVFTGSREIKGVGRKQMWYRGEGSLQKVELSPAGKSFFDAVGLPPKFEVVYANGPIISPQGNPQLEDYEVLAWYRSEKVRWEPQRGTMINTPAIVSGSYGRGRVISVSPHPESPSTPALHPIIEHSIQWLGKRDELRRR